MREETVDVVVIGLGPGGETVGGLLGKAGLDVVGVEELLVGGECPFFGCVPSKLMIAGARHAAEGAPDWAHVVRRIRDDATDDWHDDRFAERLTSYGARLVRGRGRIVGERRVRVGDVVYTARRGVVLNTGTRAAVPPIPGLEATPFWTNRDVVKIDDLPASMVVIGGGPIGAELAQVFARFGVAVCLADQAPTLLPAEEPEAGRILGDALAADGVRLALGESIDGVDYAEGRFTVRTASQTLEADRLLVAAGRFLQLPDLGLEELGLAVDAPLDVDERMRVRGVADDSGAPWLWAIGDITGKGAFTHISNYQGRVAVRDVLDESGPWADYRAATRVIYTEPEVAAVGLSEERARAAVEAGASYDVAVAEGDLGARGWLDEAEGTIKLVADMNEGTLIGGTVVGPSAGEVLGLIAAAVHARIPLSDLRQMHYAYPTYHRAIETVLWRLPH